MSNKKKAPRWLGNILYIVCLPFLIIFVIWILMSLLNKRPIQQEEIPVYSGPQITISPTEQGKKPSIEEIIKSEVNEFTEAEGETVSSSAPNIDNGVALDYSSLTVEDIIEDSTKDEELSILDKDLAIKYVEGKYKGVTKDGAFVVDTKDETKYIYLIGVTDLDSQSFADLMEGVEKIYIEYDINTKKGSGEAAYLWLTPPNNDKKDEMLNVIALKNGWGSYTDPMPNIKYQYFFLKIK